MDQQTYRKSIVVGAVAIGVIAGVAVGFFTAHGMRGDIAGMTMGPGVALAAPGGAGDMGNMTQMEMNRAGQRRDIRARDSCGRHSRL
jgi:hypothetical protein